MRIVLLLLALGVSGCSINKLCPPPWAGAIVDHERFFGLNLRVPYSSSSLFEMQLGWGSHVFSMIPVSTNKVYAAPISDTFSLGQSLNPIATKIDEDLVTGWANDPPPPRYQIFKGYNGKP